MNSRRNNRVKCKITCRCQNRKNTNTMSYKIHCIHRIGWDCHADNLHFTWSGPAWKESCPSTGIIVYFRFVLVLIVSDSENLQSRRGHENLLHRFEFIRWNSYLQSCDQISNIASMHRTKYEDRKLARILWKYEFYSFLGKPRRRYQMEKMIGFPALFRSTCITDTVRNSIYIFI